MNNDLALPVAAEKDETVFPLVSLVVLAYNNVKYTRECVESIYRHSSQLNFELITVNNGSTDGTEEYFSSLPHKKKVSFKENVGVCKAINCGYRLAEGKYVMNISNDIVATSHWLDNLLTIMESDPKIGMAVPVCNASCNYQQVYVPYTQMEDIQKFAEAYNQSNPHRWEEKLKLSTYAGIYRTDLLLSLGGLDEDFNPGSYDDDAISFSIRRMGYKVILANDTFVHHYGLRSFNEEYDRDPNLIMRNKLLFIRKFGAEPYVAGLIDFHVLDLLTYGGKTDVNVLGIGNSYGTTVLQLKNTCKLHGSDHVGLYYLSQFGQNLTDLRTICDDCLYCPLTDIKVRFGTRSYDYIVLESETAAIADRAAVIATLYELLEKGGQLVLTAAVGPILFEIMGILYGLGAQFKQQIDHFFWCFTKPQS